MNLLLTVKVSDAYINNAISTIFPEVLDKKVTLFTSVHRLAIGVGLSCGGGGFGW